VENTQRKTNELLGIRVPGDGFTEEEELIAKLMFENTIESIYSKLPTSRMKAIVALHFELGYKQDLVAQMFNISQARINQEIENIRKILIGKPFKARKEKVRIAVSDLISLCLQLQRS
jgi:predicted DNA-binding protein YlxM (UPF0122 family)